jgi:hypothetical protein
MKVRSSSEGGLVLLLSREEAQEIAKFINQPQLFDVALDPITEDPYLGLRANTKAFLDDCRSRFGDQWISWKDPSFNDLRKKHYVINAGMVFSRLEKIKAVELTRIGVKQKIDMLRFRF